LREECVDVFDGWKVEDVELNDEMSSVTIQNGEESKILETAWVVDATGRSSYLKRKLDLEQDIKHSCSSVWFRIDARITLDEWAEGDAWEWPMQMRYLATNHLMGEGYWVWLIPLSSGATSVGIVFDETFIPFDEVSTHEKAIVWLEKNEPQCAAKLRELEAECLDFRVMRKYARQTKAFFGSPRWALTGEAGSFIDPLYSSGADFIAMANTMICDLVLRERRGEDVTMRMEVLNNLLSRIFDSFVDLFRKQYGVLGHAQAMVAKIVWDFAVYWAFTCPLFFQGKLTDLAFLERLRDLSERTHYLNKTVQRFFQRWSKHEQREWTNQRIDYGKIQFMQGLLYNLTIPYEEDRLEEVLHDNLRLLQTVAMHFIEVAQEHCEPLRKYPSLTPEYAIQPAGAPTDADWVPRHLNTHLSVREDLKRIWLT
jgi:flavin-dependent dehydrogenase